MSIRSERIKSLIEQSNKSYQALEKITGIKKSSLQRYASGVTTKIPLDVIEKLSATFGVSQEYLMGWIDEPTNTQIPKAKKISTVGKNIFYMRKKLGWTQEELAHKMGYKSKSTINKIEMGINDISQRKLLQFANVLKTTPAYLMECNDNPADIEASRMHEERKSNFAKRISTALTQRNMKQAELCEKTKIPKSAISQYISGAFEPKQYRIYLIANALNVSETWLMGYDVPMEKQKKSPPKDAPLTDGEKMWLDLFRQIPEPNQQTILDVLRVALKNQE